MTEHQIEMFAVPPKVPIEWPDWFTAGTTAPHIHCQRVQLGLHPLGTPLGPEDKRCSHCRYVVATGNGGRYLKCAEHKPWTHGPATDLRMKWRSCERFEE